MSEISTESTVIRREFFFLLLSNVIFSKTSLLLALILLLWLVMFNFSISTSIEDWDIDKLFYGDSLYSDVTEILFLYCYIFVDVLSSPRLFSSFSSSRIRAAMSAGSQVSRRVFLFPLSSKTISPRLYSSSFSLTTFCRNCLTI